MRTMKMTCVGLRMDGFGGYISEIHGGDSPHGKLTQYELKMTTPGKPAYQLGDEFTVIMNWEGQPK